MSWDSYCFLRVKNTVILIPPAVQTFPSASIFSLFVLVGPPTGRIDYCRRKREKNKNKPTSGKAKRKANKFSYCGAQSGLTSSSVFNMAGFSTVMHDRHWGICNTWLCFSYTYWGEHSSTTEEWASLVDLWDARAVQVIREMTFPFPIPDRHLCTNCLCGSQTAEGESFFCSCEVLRKYLKLKGRPIVEVTWVASQH